MSEYLHLARKIVEEGKRSSVGLYLTDRDAQKIVAIALVSIAESLEHLVKLHGNFSVDGDLPRRGAVESNSD